MPTTPPFASQTTKFSAANALRLSMLANAAYLNRPDAQKVVNDLGLSRFAWIDLTEQFRDLYGFAAGCDDYAVLAFRGTANPKDWMTNLNAAPARFSWFFEGAREVGEVHSGFTLAVRHSWDAITDAVNQVMRPLPAPPELGGSSTSAQPTLWLTGHSLGGALAVLCGAAFSITNKIRLVNGVYTFGQPRVGLFNFCNNYNQLLRNSTFRFVNREDLVPRVPFRGWDYADIRTEMCRDVEEFFETLDTARKEVSPLEALQGWSAGAVEMNHVSHVGIIPTSKRHARYQIFSVNEAKSAISQQLIVVVTEVKQSDARLTESINAVH